MRVTTTRWTIANTVRIGGQVIDIPHKPRGRSYAKAYVVVRHLLDGRYRVFYGNELVEESRGNPPTSSTYEARSITAKEVAHEKAATKRRTNQQHRNAER